MCIPIDMDAISIQIKKLLLQTLNLNIMPEEISNDELLLEETIGLDSFGVLNFLVSIETWFNISFSDDDLMVEHFRTVNDLTEYVVCELKKREGKKSVAGDWDVAQMDI